MRCRRSSRQFSCRTAFSSKKRAPELLLFLLQLGRRGILQLQPAAHQRLLHAVADARVQQVEDGRLLFIPRLESLHGEPDALCLDLPVPLRLLLVVVVD